MLLLMQFQLEMSYWILYIVVVADAFDAVVSRQKLSSFLHIQLLFEKNRFMK